jgi:tripartite-type tricarboxylate transporter receptor subunit TctC
MRCSGRRICLAPSSTSSTANTALTDANVKQRLNDVSAEIIGSTPEALGEHVKIEVAKWFPIAKASGAALE